MHTAIDIHTHIVPYDLPASAGRTAQALWPQVVAGQSCQHRNVVIDGKVFRTVTEECWSVERRLEHMGSTGIGRQVLSPMPELLSYWLPTEDALVLCRHVNDAIAGMVAQKPQNFSALGCVPLQDPELAARELERLMAIGTFRGVEIGTNINGTAIGDRRFEVFYAAAEALDAALFVHPLHPVGVERLVGPPALVQLLAFPGETALSVASLITGGVLERHPKLRIAISHGGGGFALTLPRLAFGWKHINIKPGGRSPVEPAETKPLARLAERLNAKVNLIPHNPADPLPYQPSPVERVELFREILESKGVHAFVRKPRGRDILAACGQLAARGSVGAEYL